jgi:nucleoside-diphosphate-sugar epimerase
VNGRTILVTGGTGLLGSNVIRQLLVEGDSVTALVRDLDRARQLLPGNPRLTLVEGDVTEPGSVTGALHEAGAVVHTAAYFPEFYGPHPDLARLEQVNVAAVTELLGAATDAGIGVVVHTSSDGADLPAAGVRCRLDLGVCKNWVGRGAPDVLSVSPAGSAGGVVAGWRRR